jgi:hypothetical protein
VGIPVYKPKRLDREIGHKQVPETIKRLKMIKEHWKNLIMFHFVGGAPATNNAIENYCSTSLKTHRKKQFRTDMGIINQLQLSSMKRAGMFNEQKPTLLERFVAFIPFINY